MKGTTIITLVVLLGIMGSGTAQVNFLGTQTNNLNSSALGLYSNAQGYGAFASGYNANSSGFGAHALGMNAQASGMYAFAVGTSSYAPGAYTLALGKYVKATAQSSIVIGSGYQTYYLNNSRPNTMMVGFMSDRPTLFVGSAQGTGTLGMVGVGIEQPEARLDVNGEESNGLCIRTDHAVSGGYGLKIQSTHNGTDALAILFQNDTTLSLKSDGRLFVDNTLTAREVKVRIDVWKDHVLREPDAVMGLDELKGFINRNHHLPGIPPEAEVLENGISLGELGAMLLEKIEELTLYILKLDEHRMQLEKRLSSLSPPLETSTP